MEPAIGDRVVVRYRLGEGGPDDWREAPNPSLSTSPSLSDITGILRECTPDLLVVERDGARHDVPRAAIQTVRQLSRRVVRNSEIRDVERALTAVWGRPEVIDGWHLATNPEELVPRANAAVPLEFGASGRAVDQICAWYRDHDRRPLAIFPDRLTTGGAFPAPNGPAYEVLTAPADIFDDDRLAEITARAHGTRVTLAVGPTIAVEVRADDHAERDWWRGTGFDLHHTYRLTSLGSGGSLP